MNRSRILKNCLSLIVFLTISVIVSPEAVFGQKRSCGAEGQRPCKVWERIPSCNKGLKEHFQLNMCVGRRTQVDADTGKYIPRDTRKMTTVSLCNSSSRPMIYAAIAQWFDNEYGWVSRGWFKIAAGKCDKVQVDLDYTGAVYVYGSAPDGTEWDSTDAKFCIKTYDTFEIDNADDLQCPTRDHSIVGMVKLDVKPGNNNFNFGN